MQKFKKYAVVLLMLTFFPLVAFIATHFVLESDKTIYNYIPQESDIVIEINTRNFIREIMYQRIYNENYFHEKIVREEHAEPIKDIGLDIFSSVIIFREQWAESNMWMVLAGYTDETLFKSFLEEQIPGSHACFGDDFVLIQLTPFSDQAVMDDHMKKIMNGEVKSFRHRVNLCEVFDRNKEINCYITPQNANEKNQLLDGVVSLDFLNDQIKISGEFTPVSGFAENTPVAYKLNSEAPFSLRSSLNILSSVHWFNMDHIKGLPEYSQMAIDYHGVHLFMVHEDLGYTIPFKQYPDMLAHFEIENYNDWDSFFNKMRTDGTFKVDTVSHILSTNLGTYFNYTFNEKIFELTRKDVQLEPNDDKTLYFAFHMNVMDILDNIKLGIDQQNPPSENQQRFGLGIVEGQIEEVKVMSNVEDIEFQLRLQDETNMVADGGIFMKNKDGHSMIESMSFGTAAVLFIAEFIANPVEDTEF